MKGFSWLQNAVLALATDFKGSAENDVYEQASDPEDNMSGSLSTEANRAPELGAVKSRQILQRSDLPLKIWIDSDLHQEATINQSTNLEPGTWRLSGDGSVRENITKLPEDPPSEATRPPLHNSSLSSRCNTPPSRSIPNRQSSTSPTPKRPLKPPNRWSCEPKSTIIFKQSPTAPITIILTPPQTPPPNKSPIKSRNPFNDIRNFRTSSISSPKPKRLTRTLPLINKTHLAPPLETHGTTPHYEPPETRTFMITFLNTQADILPGELRKRLRGLYGIKPSDLEPNFNSTAKVDGIADPKMLLKALETAFRSPPARHSSLSHRSVALLSSEETSKPKSREVVVRKTRSAPDIRATGVDRYQVREDAGKRNGVMEVMRGLL